MANIIKNSQSFKRTEKAKILWGIVEKYMSIIFLCMSRLQGSGAGKIIQKYSAFAGMRMTFILSIWQITP